ncbi:TlyA family RNA methyltransferase [bacterium CPR1]|nr:TlyA family RNA methyltransferase [bacterium CPR1]
MKERADKLLVTQGLAPSRERAQALILAGTVYARGVRVDKPGQTLAPDQELEVRGSDHPFVSRGGLKLQRALEVFELEVSGLVALDVGASTGGFTDCLLQRGSRRVYSVDVGRGQLDWKLRQDPRVIVVEQVNARHLDAGHVSEPIDFACVDVSFISLELILGPVQALLKPTAHLVSLIKPQFEAGRQEVGKGGVVRDPRIHRQVLSRVLGFAAGLGLGCRGLTWSPVRGPAGNIEFLADFLPGTGQEHDLESCVDQAWEYFQVSS